MNQTKNKKQFLTKLKNSPYSDSLISRWMDTFKDDYVCNHYLLRIKWSNNAWKELESAGFEINVFVDKLYHNYRNVQCIPHYLVIPILIGSCDDIRNHFITQEILKNIQR
jgi:hypothetical protein